jgi:hypothetical protein
MSDGGPGAAGGSAAAGGGAEDLVEIRIVGLTIDAFRRSAEHHDELFREFALILSRDASPGHTVPGRLLALVEELGERYSGFSLGPQAELDAAVAADAESVDLVYHLPRDVRDACVHFGDLLREADEYCREGELLTLAPPPMAIDFRDWFLEEFVNQIDGRAPMSWDEYVRTHHGS